MGTAIQIPFAPIPNAFIRNPKISPESKALYALLASHTTAQDRTCFPGRRRLCDLTGGWSTKTLDKYLGELILTGWLDRTIRRDSNGRFRGWTYTVHLSPRGLEGGSSKPLADSHREVKITAPSILPPEEDPGNTPQEDTHSTPVPAATTIPQPVEDLECVLPVEEPAQAEIPQTAQAQVILLDPDQTDSRANPPKTVFIIRNIPQGKAQKPSIQDDVAAAIDWQVETAKKNGKLLNEGAYRRTLELLARRGQLDLTAYRRHVGTVQKIQVGQEQASQKWAQWEQERATPDQITAVLDEARRNPKLRALFLR